MFSRIISWLITPSLSRRLIFCTSYNFSFRGNPTRKQYRSSSNSNIRYLQLIQSKYRDAKRPFILPLFLGLSLFSVKNDDTKDSKDAAKSKPPATDDEVVHLIKLARLAEMKQDLGKSEEFYHRALSLLVFYQQEKIWDEQHIIQARVYIYDGMANLALMRGQLEKAEGLFKETLRGVMQQGMSKEDNAVIEVSLKLAMIFAAQKRDDEAITGYEFCINTLEKKINAATDLDEDTVALLGMSSDAYARFLISRLDYDAALKCLQRALDIAKKLFGDMHPQIAVLLNDMATVLSQQEKYLSAKEHLIEAISVAEATESADLPTLHCNLASLCMHLADVPQAKLQYNKSLDLAKKFNDKVIVQKATDGLAKIRNSEK